MTSSVTPLVTHNPAQQRFEARLTAGDGAPGPHDPLALCNYSRHGDLLVMHHTEVPPALQGQGVAGVLVQATLDWARQQGLRVRPGCSYVAAYMRRNPQTQDLLETAGPA